MSMPSDNYAIHKVSLKRTRQACGPCRRKKARCPGEKPVCSTCQRLGQRCSYGAQVATRSQNRSANHGDGYSSAGSDQPKASGARLQSIEQRLEEISSLIRERLPERSTQVEGLDGYLPTHEFIARDDLAPTPGHVHQDFASNSPLSIPLIESEVQVYLNDFHDQPYCVFDKQWLLENKDALPQEVLFPLVALTRRLSASSPGLLDGSTGNLCAERAWQILSIKFRDGKTDLSFLQGTFLLAQLDFADGNAHRGCQSVGIGVRVIQSYGLNQGRKLSSLERSEAEAWRRITWAFFMLDRTYNASRNYSICLSDNHFTLSFPLSITDDNSPRASLHDKTSNHEQKGDQDILASLLRLYSLWGKVTGWVFEPLVTSTLPPWQSGSALSILESEWMQFETQFADIHRYMNVDFKRRAREDPDSHPYLSTWLCVQFLFHSIQCLLHHPFVTMVKLRHMKGNLSAAFLQKSFETSLLHSRWIARFINEMSEVGLRLCDPFFGYLAAIAATIQLEHTGNKNPKIALLVNNEYRVLVRFITELSSQWGNMKVLVDRLNELASRRQNYGSLFYNQDGFSGALSSMATPSNLPRMSAQDEALVWNILDLTSFNSEESITRPPSTADLQAETQLLEAPGLGESVQVGIRQGSVEAASPEWPFEQRGTGFGSGVPDIPDWMIFGDFMSEHL
ncbi:hypothetical protein N7451_005917 [Penicillium sp. IBT 35674x]|nr:hypothetical protein N7451_005917 [Penicillium sp. IBT 35674x]